MPTDESQKRRHQTRMQRKEEVVDAAIERATEQLGILAACRTLRLICCASGKSGPYPPVFSLHGTTMRLENGQS